MTSKRENDMQSQQGVEPDRIELGDEQALARWAKKLDATPEQLREAVAAVGDKAADVEMHLKGARSTTNSDRVRELGG
jgi:phosphoserine phosphatase